MPSPKRTHRKSAIPRQKIKLILSPTTLVPIVERPFVYFPSHFGENISPLQRRLLEAQRRLNAEDERQMNLERALKHANYFDHLMMTAKGLFNYSNSRMRIAKHYTPIHTLLESVSGGKLAGKRLLHLAASTGTYVKFLQDQLHMQAVALDIDKDSLIESAARGVKRNVRAQGVFHTVSTGRFVVPPGRIIAIPEEIHVRLPFADKSFQFVVSDHFLFSDYHTNDGKADGIEYHQGSIQRSEETLPELNRILKRGGCVLVGETHGDHTPDLRRYQRNFATKGFVVMAAYDDFLRPVKKGNYPRFFVLRKVHDLKSVNKK